MCERILSKRLGSVDASGVRKTGARFLEKIYCAFCASLPSKSGHKIYSTRAKKKSVTSVSSFFFFAFLGVFSSIPNPKRLFVIFSQQRIATALSASQKHSKSLFFKRRKKKAEFFFFFGDRLFEDELKINVEFTIYLRCTGIGKQM